MLKKFPALYLTCLVALSPVGAEASDWTGFRGPAGNGAVAAELPAGSGGLGLELRWIRPLGSGYAGIAASSDILVTAFAAPPDDLVAAFDPVSGEERWRHVLGEAYAGHDGSHDGPLSTPVIDGDRVFALAPRGRLVALRLSSGELLWEVDLVKELEAPKPWYGFSTSPVFAGGRLWLEVGGEAGALAAFDPETGAVVFRGVQDEIAYQSPAVIELAGRQQVVFAGTEKVVGIDPEDGSELWTWPHEGTGPMGAMSLSPVAAGGDRIFLVQDDHASSLVEIQAKDGGLVPERLWSGRALARSYSPATVWGEQACGYVARYLSCADLATGEEQWRSRAPGDGFLAAVGGQLAVLTKKGTFHIGPANPEGWVESASLDLFEDLSWVGPSYVDGSFYLRSFSQLARVDLVRRSDEKGDVEAPIPALIAGLEERLAGGADPKAAVDALLAGRQLPVIDGEEVLFLWRGEADDVGIGGDMIGARRDEPMTRVEGTDLWWFVSRIDPGTRLSYVFFVDYQPALDPGNPRRVQGTLVGPNMDSREGGLEMSWFATPPWKGADHFQPSKADSPRGRLVEHQVEVQPPTPEGADSGAAEAPQPIAVPLHVWLPPGYDQGQDRYPVVYVHGTGAREHGGWTNTLDNLAGRAFAPLIAVFVEAPPTLPPPLYNSAFAEQIVPLIDETYRTVAESRGRTSVGQGNDADLAFAAAFANPGLIGGVGAQSFFIVDVLMAPLMAALGETTATELPLTIYLDWGKWEFRSPHEAWDMHKASIDWWNLLRERGWQPTGGEVLDGTDWASWRERTDRLLAALFPAE